MKSILVAFLLALACANVIAAETPGDSIYQLKLELTTQDGKSVGLDLHRGAPTIVTLFYGTCPHVCPMLIHSIKRLENELDAESRGRLRVLMVSIDPERDTPAALAALAERHKVDRTRWNFARTPENSVRQLAAVLGIQYRKLPDGEFNHSTVLTLLDLQGRPVAKTSLIGRLDEDFLKILRAATAD